MSLQSLSTTNLNRPFTSEGAGGPAFLSKLRKDGKLRMFGSDSTTSLNGVFLTPDEAKWYLSLPPKVRRARFSRKEQLELWNACAILIVDGAIPYSFCPSPNRSVRSSEFSDNDEEDTVNGGLLTEKDIEDEISIRGRDSFQLELEPPCQDYDLPQCARQLRKQEAIRRCTTPTQRRLHTSCGVVRPSFVPFPPHLVSKPQSPDSTLHYKDPEAREKLRKYLANPQRLDEAIEFGFPSATKTFFDDAATTNSLAFFDAASMHSIRPSIASQTTTHSVFHDCSEPITFLSGSDTSSITSTGSRSVTDDLSPITPRDKDTLHMGDLGVVIEDSESRRPSIVEQIPASLQPMLPRAFRKSSEASTINPDHSTDAATAAWDHLLMPENREMTLRVTLTRRDLRSSEADIYAYQEKPPATATTATFPSRSARSRRSSASGGSTPAGSKVDLAEDPTGMHGVCAIQAREREQDRTFVRRIARKIRG